MSEERKVFRVKYEWFNWKNILGWLGLLLLAGVFSYSLYDKVSKSSMPVEKPIPVVSTYYDCPEGVEVSFASNDIMYNVKTDVETSYSYGLKGGRSSTRVIETYTGEKGTTLTVTGKGKVVLDKTTGIISHGVTDCVIK